MKLQKSMTRFTKLTFVAGILLLVPIGCATGTQHHDNQDYSHWEGLNAAVAVIHPTAGNTASGWVRFEQTAAGVRITAEITGLAPNSTHGFHIHQFGDCSSPDGKSAGGHYNPEGHDHSLPDGGHNHAGDMGNLVADSQGFAAYVRMLPNVTIAGISNPIIGRGVIIHALADDGGQPTGNAGARIGCGVIGIAK